MENKYTYLLKMRAAFYQDICKGTYTPSDYKVYTKYLDTHMNRVLLRLNRIKNAVEYYNVSISADCTSVSELISIRLGEELTEATYRQLVEKIYITDSISEIVWKKGLLCFK
jgi:hypothetical protein